MSHTKDQANKTEQITHIRLTHQICSALNTINTEMSATVVLFSAKVQGEICWCASAKARLLLYEPLSWPGILRVHKSPATKISVFFAVMCSPDLLSVTRF